MAQSQELHHETEMIRKKSLYGISNEYQELISNIIEAEGEITPEQSEMLAINETELKNKSRNYIAVINKQTSDIDFIDKEIKRLQAIKKAKGNLVLRLKESIKNAMILYDIDEIDTTLNKINFRKSESMEIDMDLLPKKYQVIKQVVTHIPKLELKKLNKEHQIKGVTIINNKNLQIK